METAEQGGLVQILIELQDVNYPGSTYVLAYDRSAGSPAGHLLPSRQQAEL